MKRLVAMAAFLAAAGCASAKPAWVELPDDPREPLLFEKPDDRWEVNDLRTRHLDQAEELERTLRERVGEGKDTV